MTRPSKATPSNNPSPKQIQAPKEDNRPIIMFPTEEEVQAAQQSFRALLAKSRKDNEEREARFPGDRYEKMQALCRLFPSLVEIVDALPKWRSQTFVAACLRRGGGSGFWHAARFVLNVWNAASDWPEMLRDDSRAPKPKEEESSEADRILWETVQHCKKNIAADLRRRAEAEAREYSRSPDRVTDTEIEKELFEVFKLLRKFNVVDAFSTWDDDHREAFRTWARYPFFP